MVTERSCFCLTLSWLQSNLVSHSSSMELFLLSREHHDSPLHQLSSQLTAVSTAFFFLSIMVPYYLWFFFFYLCACFFSVFPTESCPICDFELLGFPRPYFRSIFYILLYYFTYTISLIFMILITIWFFFNLDYSMFKRWVGKLQLIACFCPVYKMVFICLNNWEKIQRKIIFLDTWSLYKPQVTVFIDKVLLEFRHVHLFRYYLWLLSWCKSSAEELQQRPHGPQIQNCLPARPL